MTPPRRRLRCTHAVAWWASEKNEVYVLCELRHKEVNDRVCEFCVEHET